MNNMNGDGTALENRSPQRKISLAAGLLYLLTFVSIPTLVLYVPVRNADYITGGGPDTAVIVGSVLEIIVALAGIGTAVILFQVLKKQNEGLALALVASRILEAATMFAGVAFLLSIVTLKQSGAGAPGIGQALASLYDRIFLVGQGFIPAINDVLLGYLLYRSRLVPRALSLIGIIGCPVLLGGFMTAWFGLIGQHAPVAGLFALPVAIFEFVLGVWLVARGFSPSALAALNR